MNETDKWLNMVKSQTIRRKIMKETEEERKKAMDGGLKEEARITLQAKGWTDDEINMVIGTEEEE